MVIGDNGSIAVLKSDTDKRIEDLENLGDRMTDDQKEELHYLQSKKRLDIFLTGVKEKGSLINYLYSTDSPQKDLIQNIAADLETQFIFEKKNKIPFTAVKSVGSISSYIKSLFRQMGVHDSSLSYVHKVLMFKYKADDPTAKNTENDSSDTEYRQNSSLNINYEKQNLPLIQTFCDVQDMLTAKKRVIYKNFDIMSRMTVDERLLFDTTSLSILASSMLASQSYDNRRDIPSPYQIFLFNAFDVQTNNEATSLYWVFVKLFNEKESERRHNMFSKSAKAGLQILSETEKKLYIDTMKNIAILRKLFLDKMSKKKSDDQALEPLPELTPKQAMKYMNGFVPDLIDLFNPKNRNDAITMQFYGVQCPKCGDWKVERKQNDANEILCYCHGKLENGKACGTWFEAKSYPRCISCRHPFYDAELALMKATATSQDDRTVETACSKCGREVTFDLRLMEKVVIRN